VAEVTVGVDIGTTSVKALAVDGDGVVLRRARVRHGVQVPAPDRLEHDADLAWRAGVSQAWEEVSAGLTVAEFTDSLRTALGQYVRSPSVSVEVANYRPFFILGEVARPGTYPYAVDLTVLNAVATAGGFTYRANQRRVYIRHASDSDEQGYPLTPSTPVLPGDTIRIGERLF